MAKRHVSGHWCACCGRVLANERFSGKGHARHICKACSKLDGSEKEYRQALADLDRAMRHTYPFIHKSRRKWFDALATSPNEKIKKLHAEVTADMAREREQRRRLREADERAMEEYAAGFESVPAEEPNPCNDPASGDDPEDLPF